MLRTARFAHILLGVTAATFCPQPAAAVTRTWIAPASSTSWINPNNWSPAGIPQTGDDVRTAKNSSTGNTLIDYDFKSNVVIGLSSLTLSQTNNFTNGRYSSIL